MFVEVFLFVLMLMLYVVYKDKKPSNMPPGPPEVPLLGQLPVVTADQAMRIRQQYGDIVTVRTGSRRTVHIFDYALAKEAMARPSTAYRPHFMSYTSLDEQKTGGLVSSNGPQWQHERRFVLRCLRNHGMGKSRLEEAVHAEARELVAALRRLRDPTTFPVAFKAASLNIIWQMVAGKRYDYDSKDIKEIVKAVSDFRATSIRCFIPIIVPQLKKVLPKRVRDFLFLEDALDRFQNNRRKVVNEAIAEHEHFEDTAEADLDDQDLITRYLEGLRRGEGKPDTLFRKGSLVAVVADLFSAGSDTVYHMMRWVVLLLAQHPQAADAIQEQIDLHVPEDSFVTISDMRSLPLLESFIWEALRYASLIGLNVPHVASEDIVVGGYFIPAGTNVTAVHFYIHNDPKYWEEPELFKVDRFIAEDGSFQAPKDGFAPFGTGQRQCPGETLAKQELLTFTGALLQHFDVRLPEGAEVRPGLVPMAGFRVPHDAPLLYISRR